MGTGKRRSRSRGVSRQWVRLLAALLLVALGVILRFFTIPGMRFSFYLCCGIALLLLVWCGLDLLAHSRVSGLGRFLKGVLTLLILAVSAMVVVAEGFVLAAAYAPAPDRADCLLILGAGLNGTEPSLSLKVRLDKAVSYWRDHPGVPMVVSGGQSSFEVISEAEAMRRYLVRCGVPEWQIILEDQSRTTEENVRFSKEIMEEMNLPHETVAVVSNEFHLFRARRLAKAAGLTAVGMGAETPYLLLRINYFLREAFAVLPQAAPF